MKKVFFALILLPFVISSCTPKNKSYLRYIDFVDIEKFVIPHTAYEGDTVPVYAQASAPNGCWSDLKLYMDDSKKTRTTIYAMGQYESYDFICTDIFVLKDTIFKFIPDSAGTYVFMSQSAFKLPVLDTLHVLPVR